MPAGTDLPLLRPSQVVVKVPAGIASLTRSATSRPMRSRICRRTREATGSPKVIRPAFRIGFGDGGASITAVGTELSGFTPVVLVNREARPSRNTVIIGNVSDPGTRLPSHDTCV